MNADLAGRLRDADPVRLGERIRNLRLARGLTQAALANGAVTVGYISRIEAGQRRPDVALVERFAEVLGTTAEHVVTGVEPVRADEILLTLLHAELALETGSATEALTALGGVTGAAGADLPADLRQRAEFLAARAMESLGRYDDAISALEKLVDSGAGRALFLPGMLALSRCHRDSGDLTRAIDVGEQALAALKEAGIDGGDEAIRLVVTVAAAYFERGDVGHAVRVAREAVRRAEAMGSPAARAAAYWEASVFESRRGGSAAAIPYAERALALLAGSDDRRNLPRLRAQLGVMMLRLDPPDTSEAIEHLQAARDDLVASSAGVVDVARCDVALARAHLLAGDDARAIELGQQSFATTREVAPALAAEAAALLGMQASNAGDPKAAASHYREAVGLLTGVGQDRQAAQLWLELGSQLEQLGDVDTARDAYRRAAVATGLQIPAGMPVNR
ncbi:MAG TPA: helix-turn-helix domain-containing protein [Mycobacteriales bacterium]|nr:helix-turn-helix domain-containing protein [Mycobacteriales bacterium]